AYEAILYARRRELHRRVARRIEELHRDRLDEQLALLARHYLLAEEWEPAFDYHLRAGRQAQARYANREAITLYERALQLGPRLDLVDERRETKDQTTSSDDAGNAADEPSSLVFGRSSIVELHERLGVVHALIGEYDIALERYQAALDLLQKQPDATIEGLGRLHHHV